MRILVLQLARFGDVYLTWPTLRSLRRAHPGAEIHLMVRERFAAATEGLGAGVIVRTLPTAKLLAPFVADVAPAEALKDFDAWLADFQGQWDLIINLSFSPASSYLVDCLATGNTEVHGYRRHSDGFLAIPDDASAYFYAQVGPGRANRFHLADIFAMVAGVDITIDDWGFDGELPKTTPIAGAYVVFHLGASQENKRYDIRSWAKAAERILNSGCSVVLIGSKDEVHLAESFRDHELLHNRIGQTSLVELFPILAGAKILVGADSAPIHVASHLKIPVLNLSFSTVSYWETGPCSPRSYVLLGEETQEILPSQIAEAVDVVLHGHLLPARIIQGVSTSGPRFAGEPDFAWQLILALYTHANYPSPPADPLLAAAIARLSETAELGLEQLHRLQEEPGDTSALAILSSIDAILDEVGRLAPDVVPLIRWFQTERVRLAPAAVEETRKDTQRLFSDFEKIVQVLTMPVLTLEEVRTQGLGELDRIDKEIQGCALAFRLFQLHQAKPMLNRMIEGLSFLEKNSLQNFATTKVEAVKTWKKVYADYRNVLSELINAFECKDYVYVADLVEYELTECLHQWRFHLVSW